jgi:hypothetical protein
MAQNNKRTQRLSKKVGNSELTEDQYTSVEFRIKDLDFIHQFRIWETKTPEISILVNRNSAILKYLHVGNTIDIKCIPSDGSIYPVTMRTEIKHIKENVEKRLNGHFLVSLAVN